MTEVPRGAKAAYGDRHQQEVQTMRYIIRVLAAAMAAASLSLTCNLQCQERSLPPGQLFPTKTP
jgi:hypothetical protein